MRTFFVVVIGALVNGLIMTLLHIKVTSDIISGYFPLLIVIVIYGLLGVAIGWSYTKNWSDTKKQKNS